MALYQCKAKNINGEHITDIIEADSVTAVTSKLQASGYFPLSIEPYEKKGGIKKDLSVLGFSKVSHSDIVLFTRRLADSLKGGLPLIRTLGVLERQTENKEFARITREIKLSVQEGRGFSESLAKYPKIFSEMYVGMVKAGESAGLLDSVLLRLAEFNEKEEELKYRINAALAYPLVMLVVGLASVIFLLAFVIPRFEIIFGDLGQAIPLPTMILILISKSVRHWWWLYFIVIFGTAGFLIRFYKTSSGKGILSRMKLSIPIVGSFIKKDLVSRFIRMLSVLLGNGVPILDALDMAKSSIGNKVFADEIDKIYQSVKEGQGIVAPMSKSKLFPPMVSEMVAIGEETGNLESSLLKIAEAYDREVEYAVKTMTSLIEPVIILFAGVVVCLIALSMLLPVFQMSIGIR